MRMRYLGDVGKSHEINGNCVHYNISDAKLQIEFFECL